MILILIDGHKANGDKSQVNVVSATVSFFLVFYVLVCISVNALINVKIIILLKSQDINTIDDIFAAKNVRPAIYKATSLELILVLLLHNRY